MESNYSNLKSYANTHLGKLFLLVIIICLTKRYGSLMGITFAIITLYLLNTSLKEGMNGMKGSRSDLANVYLPQKRDNSSSYGIGHKSNTFNNLYYYIPPKTMGQIEKTRMKNKETKTTSSDRLFIEELLKNNKINNIVINFNRGNKGPLNKNKKEPEGNYYSSEKNNNKLKKDPYSCSV